MDSMVISSPNYPLPYDHNASCDWILTVHPDYNVTFLFTAMDLEFHQNCLYDYVEVNSRYKVKVCVLLSSHEHYICSVYFKMPTIVTVASIF